MKKVILFIIIAGAMTVSAFAQGGFGGMGGKGHHNGGSYNNGAGGGFHSGGMWNNNGNQQQVATITEAEAKTKVETYIQDNRLKGFKLGTLKTYTTPRGFNMYTMTAKDAGGNDMEFHINPYGSVVGPMIPFNR